MLHQQAPPSRRFSRIAIAGISVASAVLVGSLVQLLAPRSGSSVLQTASQPLDTSSRHEPITDEAVALTEVKPRGPVTTHTRRSTVFHRPNVKSFSTLVLTAAHRAAVAVGDGRHALTTATALEPDQQIDVLVSDGDTIRARVISVNTKDNIAVLELERVMSGAAREITYERPDDGDHVTIGSDATDAYVRVTPSALELDADKTANEGEPVVDEDGKLIGLISRGADGTLQLVTIPRRAALQATVLVIDVWLGLRFEQDSLRIIDAQADAPAAAAGIVAGDTLTAIDGAALSNIDDLWIALARMSVGQLVNVDLLRDGATHTVSVTLTSRPS
jgi:hypothetical protein